MSHILRLLFLSVVLFVTSSLTLEGNISSDAVIDLQASVSDTSPCITLSWTQRMQSNITSQQIFRRLKGASSWGTALSSLTPSQSSYADTTALPNVEYEYWMKRQFNATPYTAIGYISAGGKVPEVHARGTLLLVVDSTMVTSLATEISQLRDDLAGDGWTVQQITAPRTGTAASTKVLIKAAYDADPTNVKMVYLLGRVPVPYSGFIGPDGHGSRAWPTDGYYADMNGTWTDTQNFSTSNTGDRSANIAGDGKFDQHYYPSVLELQVGRVDMSNLNQAPSVGTSETALLRRYLKKAHDFRHKQGAYASVPRRTLFREGFVNWTEAFAADAWATSYTCVAPSTANPSAVDESGTDQWFNFAGTNTYLTGHINGGGGPTSIQNGAISIEFGRKPSKVVFPSAFGSYSGDWDFDNAVMRTILAGNSTGDSLALTCYWAGRPHYFVHHLGMGETFGCAIRNSQNANISGGGSYTPGGTGFGQVHVGMIGDPALRMHAVEPPRNFTATSANSQVTLSWSGSTESALQGYHVYRAATSAGPFAKLTASPLAVTSYTDVTATGGQSYVYMVRTLKLETTPSGSYYNLSIGALLPVTVNASATAAPRNPTNVTVTQTPSGLISLTWTDNSSDETGFRIERKPSSGGTYTQRGTTLANVATFVDNARPIAGSTYYYRVIAINGAIQSVPAAETFFEASGGTVDFQTVTMRRVNKDAGSIVIPVERFGGVTGAATVNYSTANGSATSGTHFTGGSGSVSWLDGEGGVKNITIPITNTATPQQARQFRLNLTSSAIVNIGQYSTMAVLIDDPGATLPSPWNQLIIQDPYNSIVASSPAVQAEGAIGSLTVGGYGLDNDTSRKWESGQFIYQSRTGDGVLTAYMASANPAQIEARFAVMVRDDNSYQSAMAATVVTGDTGQGSRFIYRSAVNATNVLAPVASNSLTTPRWIRLIRSGNTFTSQVSPDGATWTTLGTATVALSATANWGLFHNSFGLDFNRQPFGNYQLALFQNVTFGDLPAPVAPSGLSAGTVTSNSVPLTWSTSTYASGYRIERRSEDGTLVQFPDITSGATLTFNDTTAQPDTAYEYRIRAFGSGGESSPSAFIRAVTPQPDLTTIITTDSAGGADASVEFNNPSTNFGGGTTLPITACDYYVTTGFQNASKAWMQFDLGTLPSVKSAKLKLSYVGGQNLQSVFDGGNSYYMMVRLLAETSDVWDEGTITWNNAPQNDVSNQGLTGTAQILANSIYDDIASLPAENSIVEVILSATSINTYRGANNKLTLALIPNNYYSGTMTWASREHATLPPPTLEVVAAPMQPKRPGFFTVTPGSGGSFNLAWFDGAADETGFRVERRVANGDWILIAALPANTNNFTDTTSLPGVLYEYRVRTSGVAADSTASSVFSPAVTHTGEAAITAAVTSFDGVNFQVAEASGDRAHVPTGFTFAPPSSPLVTGQTLSSTIRNNYNGWLGMQFTVGASPLTVRELGRWVIAGSTGNHNLKLVVGSTKANVPGGSVVIATSGVPTGFKYAALGSPVTLAANTAYYLVSQETFGGDQFYQGDTSLTTTTVATINSAIWSANGTSYSTSYLPGNSYIPVSFTYSGGASPFVTGHAMTTLRNDIDGWFGMEVTTGASAVTVGELGRWVVPGNSGTHNVKLVDAGTGLDLGMASVATAGAPTGQFKYGSISPSVTLAPNSRYYVVSQEGAGGDQWYDFRTPPSGTASGYQYWLLANGLPMDGSGSGSATATPASDGLPNLVKYALGLTPTVSGNSGRLRYGETTIADNRYFTFTYIRPDPAPAGVNYWIEASSGLASDNWSGSGLVEISNTLSAGLRTITTRDNTPVTASHRRFMRLKVTQP